MHTDTMYVLLVRGKYHAVTASRFLLVAGRIVAVEGEDAFGNRWPINQNTLVRAGNPRVYERDEQTGLRLISA